MVQPLALLLYEKLLPGSQLAGRLRDQNFRVQTLAGPAALSAAAILEKPMLVLAGVNLPPTDVFAAIRQLRENPSTRHIPVIVFGPDPAEEWSAAAEAAGATLIISETAVLAHLPQLLERALQVE